MTRFHDWPERLHAYVDARRGESFTWGTFDCALFACDWILEATGEDVIADLRGSWSDERSALRTLADLGGLQTIASVRLGAPISAALAQRGDIVLHTLTGRDALGVCVGAHFAGPAIEGGLVLVPMERAFMAWRV